MRYFFNITNGHDTPDLEGTELASLEEVKFEALKAAGEVLSAKFGEPWNMTVADESGKAVISLRFEAHEHG